MNHFQILQQLPADFPWREQIHYFDTIDSTNTRSKLMAAQGAPHGTVLVADHQTGGRGRLGRSFHSPTGAGIYLSLILRPGCAPTRLMHLTCATAVAMCDAVEEVTGTRPGIKWTNDLVRGSRKIAGILTEMALDSSGNVSYAVIGVGINCSQQESDFPPEIRNIAGSLSMVTGKTVSRAGLAAAMIRALHRMDAQLLTHTDEMLDAYRHNCITLGQDVSILRGESVMYGKAVDIDAQGALIVRFSDGHSEAVNSGEVSVRGMYGYV